MNKEKLARLIDFLETLPDERFDMNHFFLRDGHNVIPRLVLRNTCGTVGCIAGWAAALFDTHKVRTMWLGVETELDLTEDDAHDLFLGHWSSKPLDSITREDCIAYLKHQLELGEWKISNKWVNT